MGFMHSMEYRTDFALSLLSGIFPVGVQLFLWNAVYGSSQESVYGYTKLEVIGYTLLAALFAKMMATGFEYEISKDIKDGQLSKFIVQPIRYGPYRLSRFLGEKGPQLIVLAVLAGIACVLLRIYAGLDITGTGLLLCAAALIVSVLLNFLIYYCLSTVSFWLLEVWGIFYTFALIALLASGGVFPIDMFGPVVQQALGVLPFPYLVFFPVHIALGRVDGDALLQGFGVQFIWIVVLIALTGVLWRAGLRKYESAGG